MTLPATNVPYAIITDAMQDAGLLQLTQQPTGEQLASGMRRLRDLINLWQTQGLKLWLLSDTAVPLTAGIPTYSFQPGGNVNMTRPLRVLQGYYLTTSTGARRPISSLSWEEYLRLGVGGSGNQGTISQYFVNKLARELQVTFWLCPDATEAANGEAHVLLQTQATNPAALDETMAFPEECRMALRWGLADDLATGQPPMIMERCTQKAAVYRGALEDFEVEDTATRFEPNLQGYVRSFR